MIRRFSINFTILSFFFDLVGIVGVMFLAVYLRPVLNFLPFAVPIAAPINYPLSLFFVIPIVWVGAFLLLNVYNGQRNLRIVDEFTSMTLGAILATVLLAGILYLTSRDVSRILFISTSLLIYFFCILWRIVARQLVTYHHHSSIFRRVLIAGRGPVGQDFSARASSHGHNLSVVGFLDDDPVKRAKYQDVLGNLDDIRMVIDQQLVTDVIIALPSRAHQRLDQLVTRLIDVPVQVWIIPDYFHLTLHSARIDDFLGIPMLNVRGLALDEYQLLVKRIMDVILSGLAILIASPLMVLVALAIWLNDRGPVIFSQQRVGVNGKLFTMYKFRTMKVDAEKMQDQMHEYDSQGNVIHKRRDDPRITRVGRLLRRLSLDELPQFFNVLIGNMSLVGPRPELPYLVEMYKPWQRKRFTVPQGLTGWWQIHGRSDKPMHLHTEDDLYYIENYSFWLDVKIIVRTAWTILRGKGAY